MKLKFCYFIYVLVFCSISIKVQNYSGTIGKYQILLNLSIDYDDNNASGYYFYNSQLKIFLELGS